MIVPRFVQPRILRGFYCHDDDHRLSLFYVKQRGLTPYNYRANPFDRHEPSRGACSTYSAIPYRETMNSNSKRRRVTTGQRCSSGLDQYKNNCLLPLSRVSFARLLHIYIVPTGCPELKKRIRGSTGLRFST